MKKDFFGFNLFALIGTMVLTSLLTVGVYKNYEKDEPYASASSEMPFYSRTIAVSIKGEVNNPGYYEIQDGTHLKQAIECAGGETENADLLSVNLAELLEDGEEVYIPSKNGENTVYENKEKSYTKKEVFTGKVNINTAGKSELKKLSGIGDAIAQRIIDYRTKNGAFKTIEEIKNVNGIGDAKFNAVKDNIEI